MIELVRLSPGSYVDKRSEGQTVWLGNSNYPGFLYDWGVTAKWNDFVLQSLTKYGNLWTHDGVRKAMQQKSLKEAIGMIWWFSRDKVSGHARFYSLVNPRTQLSAFEVVGGMQKIQLSSNFLQALIMLPTPESGGWEQLSQLEGDENIYEFTSGGPISLANGPQPFSVTSAIGLDFDDLFEINMYQIKDDPERGGGSGFSTPSGTPPRIYYPIDRPVIQFGATGLITRNQALQVLA